MYILLLRCSSDIGGGLFEHHRLRMLPHSGRKFFVQRRPNGTGLWKVPCVNSSLVENKMHQHIPILLQNYNQLRFQMPRCDQEEIERTSEQLCPKMSAVKWHHIFPSGPHVAFQYGLGEGRNQEGWDALFNMFVECGENWLQCDLVTQNSDVREHARNGSWGLMSKVVTWKQPK